MNNTHFDTYFTETKTRLLILSDIHFRIEYDSNLMKEFQAADAEEEFNKIKKNEIARNSIDKNDFEYSIKRLEKYIENFVEKVVELNDPIPFDYLLINGDIAFSGETKQYQLFKHQVLDKIVKVLPNISIIQISGNHDISIKNTNHYFKELASDNSFKKRNGLLSGHYDVSFKSYFENFSAYQSEYISALQNKQNIKVHLIDNLFGYIIDHNKRTIFMLLNSAWYCLGPKWAEVYIASNSFVDGFMEGSDKKNVKSKLEIMQLKELIEKGQEFYEHEKLITGMELLQSKLPKALTVFNDYPNYFCILQVHHPINWLHWNEVYDADSKLSKLMNDADICIFGHQHLPKLTSTKKSLQTNTFSIDAGMFSADNLFMQNSVWNEKGEISPFEQCRFSVLDITNSKTKKFKETKYFVQQHSNAGAESVQHSYEPKKNDVSTWVDGDSYFLWQEYTMYNEEHSIDSQIPVFKVDGEISKSVTSIKTEEKAQEKFLKNYWGAKNVEISPIKYNHTINIWVADKNIYYILIDTLAIFTTLLETFISKKSFFGITEPKPNESTNKLPPNLITIKLISFDFLTDVNLNYNPSNNLNENRAMFNTIEQSNQIQFQVFKAKMIKQIKETVKGKNLYNIEFWKPIVEAVEFVTIPYWNIVFM
jgi:predicted MPP superfamily phosphohydrolase